MSSRIRVRFPLTKGDGNYPDLELLPRSKRTTRYVKSCMYFIPDFREADHLIASWELVDDGLRELELDEDVLCGYPAPIVEFVLRRRLTHDELNEFVSLVWFSCYGLRIPDLNGDDAWYFEDHSGYTHILETREAPGA